MTNLKEVEKLVRAELRYILVWCFVLGTATLAFFAMFALIVIQNLGV
jgi:hypothetical protein